MCTHIYILYTMYTTLLLQWVEWRGSLFMEFVVLFLSFSAVSIFERCLSNNKYRIKDQNHVQCNNVKTQYYLQSEFKTSEILSAQAIFLFFFIYKLWDLQCLSKNPISLEKKLVFNPKSTHTHFLDPLCTSSCVRLNLQKTIHKSNML